MSGRDERKYQVPRFIITRTSNLNDDIPPCEDVVLESYIDIDVRTVSRPEDIESHKEESDWWYDEGTNHRVGDDNQIRRDFVLKGWFMHFSSPQKFIEFVTSGKIFIIQPCYRNPDIIEIEIYDDYNE